MTESQKDIAHLAKLFQIEKQHELEVYKGYLEAKSPQQRKKLGVCWFPLKVTDSGFGTASLPFATVARNPGDRTPHEFYRGKPVTLLQEGSSNQVFGHVLKVDDDEMVLALSGEDVPDWIDDGDLSVNVIFDTKTFEEGEKTLSTLLNAEKGRVKELRDKLYGYEDLEFGSDQHIQIPKLNESQNAAVGAMLSARDLSVVYGPPGTGKTTTLVAGIKQLVKRENRVLACAPSNAATDHLTAKLMEAGVKVVRLGALAKIEDDVLGVSLDAQIQNHPQSKDIQKLRREISDLRKKAKAYKRTFGPEDRQLRKDLFKEARELAGTVKSLEEYVIQSILQVADVVTCTLVGATHKYLQDIEFSVAIVDEAGQSLEPLCWIPMLRAHRTILAGDPHQLPPTVKSHKASKEGLGTTLLDKAIKLGGAATMLDTQYRMNEAIMAYSNDRFYEGKLLAHESVAQHCFDDKPLEFIDTAGCGFDEGIGEVTQSRFNTGEIDILSKHLESLSFTPSAVAIISPYREQVIQMLQHFSHQPEIRINTIDSFQGQEQDMVYISLVRSNDTGEIGFLSDYRRMNVAMTRARKKLVIIGDSATVGQDQFYAGLIQYCEDNGFYRSAWELLY